MTLKRAIEINLLVLACSAVLPARGAEVANWVGGNGLWSDATKWSGGVVPANNGGTTYTVNIDNGSAAASHVTLDGASVTRSLAVDALTIDGGDSLAVRCRPKLHGRHRRADGERPAGAWNLQQLQPSSGHHDPW